MQATKNILNELYQRIYELEDLIITIPHKLIDYKDNSHEQSIKSFFLKFLSTRMKLPNKSPVLLGLLFR